MSRLIIISIIAFAIAQISTAQDIIEEERTMSLGTNMALVIDMPYASQKVAEDVWKDFIKNYGRRTKKVRREDEWYTDNAFISAINGTESIDIYARIEGTDDYARTAVWFDLGTSFLYSLENEEGYREARQMLTDYGLDVKREMISIELEDAEKELSNLESSLKKLQRDNEGYHKDIEQARERIREAEADIEENLIEQVNARQNIDKQEETIRKIKRRIDKVGRDQ